MKKSILFILTIILTVLVSCGEKKVSDKEQNATEIQRINDSIEKVKKDSIQRFIENSTNNIEKALNEDINERHNITMDSLNKIKSDSRSSFRNNILNSKAQPGSIIDVLQKLEKYGVSGFDPNTLDGIEEEIIKLKKQFKNDKDAIAYLDNVLYKIKKGIESQNVPIPIKDTI